MRKAITLVGFVVALVAAAWSRPRPPSRATLATMSRSVWSCSRTCRRATTRRACSGRPTTSRPIRSPRRCSLAFAVFSRVRQTMVPSRCSSQGSTATTRSNSLYDAYTPNGFSGGAPGCDTEGTWGDGEGRLKCYSTGSGSGVVWTLEADNLVFAAFRGDDDVERALRVVEARCAADRRSSGRDQAADRRAMACERAGPGQVGAEGAPRFVPAPGHQFRGPRTSVSQCPAGPRGVDLRPRRWRHRLRFVSLESRRAVQAYADAYAPAVDEEAPRVQSDGVDCEGAGTWSRRGGQGGGDRLCWFEASGLVAMLWTDNSQAVVVEAARE